MRKFSVRYNKMILAVILAVSFLLTGLFATSNHNGAAVTLASAASSYTGKIMSPEPLNMTNAIKQDQGGRKYTIEELFASDLSVTPFYGNRLWEKHNNLILRALGDADSQIESEELDELGEKGFHAIFGGLFAWFHSVFIKLTSIMVSLTKIVTSSVFSQSLICKDPDGDEKGCINLLKIVGGTKGGTSAADRGIIGTVADGIFFPMLLLAIAAAALYILWLGAARRQYRKAGQAMLWILLVFVIGVWVWQKPYVIARAPNEINNVVTSCLLGGLSGGNCLSDDNNQEEMEGFFVGKECQSYSSQSNGLEFTEYLINGVNCSMWKAFVLEPWCYSQFGVPYEDLEGGGQSVSMYSSKSPEELTGSFMNGNFSGQEATNTALTWLAIQKGYFLPSGQTSYTNEEPPEEAKAIVEEILSDRPETLYIFAGKQVTLDNTFMSAVASFLVALTVIKLGIAAHVQSFAGTILLVFAPIFLVMAVHYGKGRRIFLGWLEKVISCILKFFALATMLLVLLLIMNAIFMTGAASLYFVGSILVTMTFKTYQKEFVNMIGQTSMGGQFVSDALGRKIGDGVKKAGQTAKGYVVAPAVTATVAFAKSEKGQRWKASRQAAKAEIQRRMARGDGVVAHATREWQRQTDAKEKQEARERRKQEAEKLFEQHTKHVEQDVEKQEEIAQAVGTQVDLTTITAAEMQRYGENLELILEMLKEQEMPSPDDTGGEGGGSGKPKPGGGSGGSGGEGDQGDDSKPDPDEDGEENDDSSEEESQGGAENKAPGGGASASNHRRNDTQQSENYYPPDEPIPAGVDEDGNPVFITPTSGSYRNTKTGEVIVVNQGDVIPQNYEPISPEEGRKALGVDDNPKRRPVRFRDEHINLDDE